MCCVADGTNDSVQTGEKLDDPLAMYLNDVATIPVNLVGNAAMSLPIGLKPRRTACRSASRSWRHQWPTTACTTWGAALETALRDKWGHLLIEEAPAP